MCEKAEGPARHPYTSAREKVNAMYHRLSACSALEVGSIASWEDVLDNLARLQDVLMDLQAAKDQLLAVNLQVHRFTTEYGHDAQYRDCTLKADVTELYRQWDDLYERNGLQLTEMETVKKEWETFYDQLESLRLRLKISDSEDDCDNLICPTSVENDDNLRQSFELLKRASLSLENRLKGGEAWKKIDRDLNDLERRIKRLDTSPNKTTFRSANHRSPSTLVEEDADDHFEDAIQQLCEDSEEPTGLSTHHEKEASPASPKKRGKSRFWRIVRMAVPVQLALVLLYCLACYMEPSCCNMLNNFNFSLTPQLRYFEGPPPV